MCETFPPNQREACDIPRTSIKVGAENRLLWILHDLRRTFATNLAALAVPPHITERLLNHATGTISGVAAIYNRFLDEMRAAIALWEERLAWLLAQHAPPRLTPRMMH